jgi:hypothetical protein
MKVSRSPSRPAISGPSEDLLSASVPVEVEDEELFHGVFSLGARGTKVAPGW